MRTPWFRGEQDRDPCVKHLFPRAAESACLAVEGLEPGFPADAGAARARQTGHDLTLNLVKGYKLGVQTVKKEIPIDSSIRQPVVDPWLMLRTV